MIMCWPVRTNAHLCGRWQCGAKVERHLAGTKQTVSNKTCSKGLSWTISFTRHNTEMKQSFQSDRPSSVHITAQYCFSHRSQPCQDTSCYEVPHMWISCHFLAMFLQFLPGVESVHQDEQPADVRQSTEEWRLCQIQPGRRAALELWCLHLQFLMVEKNCYM